MIANDNKFNDGTNWDGRHDGKFFEEFCRIEDGLMPKDLGVRIVEDNKEGRPLGVAGKRTIILTEDIILLRCFKQVKIRASIKKPVKVFTMLQKLGR